MLTEKQTQLFAHIVQYETENGKYPRITDLVEIVGGDLEAVRQMVKRMAKQGAVKIINHKEPRVRYATIKRVHPRR